MVSVVAARFRYDRCLIVFLFLLAGLGSSSAGIRVTVGDAESLRRVFSIPVDSIEVRLLPGTYHLVPVPFTDSSCGNCEDALTPVPATLGLHVRGSSIQLVGPPDTSAIIVTHAGYGIFFENCTDCSIQNITITGGERDTSGNATDAAIVVKNSKIDIRGNAIVNNIGDSATVNRVVVGIAGIALREGTIATITHNRIIRNSWDGIALYRGVTNALISNNIIDGVDKARGATIGGGRGVGIGATWNARATILSNLVTRYWKGIGVFVDARATVFGNVVEDILTWGIAFWDAGKGSPVAFIENNVIYKTGACGASITQSLSAPVPSRFTGNILVQTAQNPRYDSPDYYCYQCALAVHAAPKEFVLRDNHFFNNRRATPDLPDYDVSLEEFRRVLPAVHARLRDANHLQQSQFFRDFLSGR